MRIINTEVQIPINIEVNERDTGMFSCFINEYGIAFSTKDESMIEHKARVMMKAMIDYLLEENNKKGK